MLEWFKQKCPLLNPENISIDFELAEMNSAKAVFNIDPTGCDFHYNQAILRKIGKKGLKKTMSKNAEFKKWVYQTMALNHLLSNKIEAAFRELCARPIPLSETAKKAKESFQRYWLNTIAVDRLSVYRVPLRTSHQVSLTSHAESAWTERLMQSFSHVVTVSAFHVEIFLSSRRSHATSAGGRFGVSRGFT